MIAALKFFLGTDERTDDGSESESSDDEAPGATPAVQPNKEDIYKAYKKGTGSSKKKKQAKLKRVMQSLKKQQRSKEGGGAVSFAALQLLNDPQGFVERLFARLRACSERFEVRCDAFVPTCQANLYYGCCKTPYDSCFSMLIATSSDQIQSRFKLNRNGDFPAHRVSSPVNPQKVMLSCVRITANTAAMMFLLLVLASMIVPLCC